MDELIKKLVSFNFQSWLLLILSFILIGIWIFKQLKNKKIKKISTPVGSVEFGDDNINNHGQSVKSKSPHSNCIYAKDVVKVLQLQRLKTREADKIEMQYIPRDLMNCAEDELENIVAQLESIFLELLKENRGNNNNLVKDRSYNMYQNALALMKKDILKEIFRMVRENNFEEKENQGIFGEYKKTKARNILNLMIDGLNRYYVEDSPSREQVYDRNREVRENYRKGFDLIGIFENMIESMKDLSKNHNIAIRKCEKEIDDKIQRLFA